MILLALCASALLLFGGCAGNDVAPFTVEPDLRRDYTAFIAEIGAAVDSSPALRSVMLGTVKAGEAEYPVIVVHFDASGGGLAGEGRVRMLITGGVHGNEPAGAAWTLELIRRLADDPGTYRELQVDVIPMVNPWGWAHDTRFNADGRDINRDFSPFRTPEAQIVRDFLADRDYDLVIDHHEDLDARGVYLYQYGLRDQTWSRQAIATLREAGYPVEQDVNMIILRTDDGLIDAPMWGLRYMRLTGQLSITNYIRLAGNRHVYTVETPTHLPIESRIRAHRMAFDLLTSRAVEIAGQKEL